MSSVESKSNMEDNIKQRNSITLDEIKKDIVNKVKEMQKKNMTLTKPGSIKHLLFGSEPSKQSWSIKMGKVGEDMIKCLIELTDGFILLQCGVQCIDQETKKYKDLDLFWMDKNKKIIYYREVKGNVNFDSEKLPATIAKVKEITETYIINKYPDYTIDFAIFHWSIYNRKTLKKGQMLSSIKKFEANGIKIEHPEDLFKIFDFNWSEKNYYNFFLELGKLLRE